MNPVLKMNKNFCIYLVIFIARIARWVLQDKLYRKYNSDFQKTEVAVL